MKLHNKIYHESAKFHSKLNEIIKAFIHNSLEVQHLTYYVELANNNLDKLQSSIKKANLYYKDKTITKISFHPEQCYPLTLWFKDIRGHSDFTDFDFDTLIIMLDEAGILEDAEIDE